MSLSEILAKKCASEALEKKAENVVILNVAALTSFADYFVVCSAPSERQTQAIAQHVMEEVKASGTTVLGIEGLEDSEWVLLDMGDVILHVFSTEARLHYDLEGFWSKAPREYIDSSTH